MASKPQGKAAECGARQETILREDPQTPADTDRGTPAAVGRSDGRPAQPTRPQLPDPPPGLPGPGTGPRRELRCTARTQPVGRPARAGAGGRQAAASARHAAAAGLPRPAVRSRRAGGGVSYDGKTYRSLSAVARAITGSYWSGDRFFGVAEHQPRRRGAAMSQGHRTHIRCAIYTRKSHEEGLDQEFNSLDAQREAGEAYIASQKHEGWSCLPDRYDDGGFTGGNMERPGPAAAAGRHRGRQGRLRRRLQGRPPEPVAAGLRPDHGGVRPARGVVRLGHAAVQHDHPHGPADAQHPAVLRPVRAGDHRRAHPRQEAGHRPRRASRSAASRCWGSTSSRRSMWSTKTRPNSSVASSICTWSTSRPARRPRR